jgi:hypothetical protein
MHAKMYLLWSHLYFSAGPKGMEEADEDIATGTRSEIKHIEDHLLDGYASRSRRRIPKEGERQPKVLSG